MSALASEIDPTLDGDLTEDGRDVKKSNLQGALQAAKDDFDDLSAAVVRHVRAEVSLAELNAGKTILAGVTGRTLRVVDFLIRFDGTFATGDSVELEDTNDTPNVIASVAAADMGDGDKYGPEAPEVTLDKFGTDLATSAGLAVTKTGNDFTGGTSIILDVLYVLGE